MKTNAARVVKFSVQGKVVFPEATRPHLVDANGGTFMLPSMGGITYNVKVGDPAFGWSGDHIEPGVSTLVDEEKRFGKPNTAYHFYSCVGNEALIVSGDAKGKKGFVTGHHGGAEHVILDFADDAVEKLTMDDKFLIKGWGQGLKLLDYPDIHIYNLDPGLLKKMGIKELDKGRLGVPVAKIIPGHLMGSGVGFTDIGTGDCDIMTTDRAEIAKLDIDKLRLGDFVAVTNHDNVFGRSWRKGAVTIGIVIHSDCMQAGHGPGVTTLMTSAKPLIAPRVDGNANIGKLLKIGRYRPAKKKKAKKKN